MDAGELRSRPIRSGHHQAEKPPDELAANGSGFDYRITPGGLAEVLHEALAVAPGLASGTCLETRIGFRPMGPDIKPLPGAVPGIDGLTVPTGLGASGLTIGPYAGELAARAALGASVPLDLSPFSPVNTREHRPG